MIFFFFKHKTADEMRISDWSSDVCSSDLNCHKIWTSQAQIADWMYALIRTGPLHPKHAGISVVLIPMDSDGIEVRPIRRNNGDYHFNEVFFDNVRVPLDNIVGSMNRSEEHTSELQSLMRISYAVFCLKKKKKHYKQ